MVKRKKSRLECTDDACFALLSLPDEVLTTVLEWVPGDFAHLRCVCTQLNALISPKVYTLAIHAVPTCELETVGGDRRRRKAAYMRLPTVFPNVKELCFSNCCNNNDVAHFLTRVAPNWGHLRAVSLPCGSTRHARRACAKVGEAVLGPLTVSCPSITNLRLQVPACKKTIQLLGKLTSLTNLDCRYVGKQPAAVQQLLPDGLTRLTNLALSPCLSNEEGIVVSPQVYSATQINTLALLHVSFPGQSRLNDLLSLTALQCLQLGGCAVLQLSQAVEVLAQITGLRELHLAIHDENNRAPTAQCVMAGLHSLQHLHTLDIHVEDACWGPPPGPCCLPLLQRLTVRVLNPLTTADPLPSLPMLSAVDVRLASGWSADDNEGLETMLSTLCSLPSVQELCVQMLFLHMRIVKDLAKLKHVRRLRLFAAHDTTNGNVLQQLQQSHEAEVQVVMLGQNGQRSLYDRLWSLWTEPAFS